MKDIFKTLNVLRPVLLKSLKYGFLFTSPILLTLPKLYEGKTYSRVPSFHKKGPFVNLSP